MKPTRDPEELSYRWIILAASFAVRFIMFGILFSVGVLYVAWLDEFQTSKGNTAWIGSLATGSSLCAGPLGSALISKIGTRKTTVLGGVVMATGLLLSVFASNIYALFFTYGILAGTGGGIANLAAVVRLTDYFKRQRALAMGIGSSGVGLGAFAFTVFQQYLLDQYGWRGSLLIMAGISLNICIAGLLMIHPKHHPRFANVVVKVVDLNSNEEICPENLTKNGKICAENKVLKLPQNLEYFSNDETADKDDQMIQLAEIDNLNTENIKFTMSEDREENIEEVKFSKLNRRRKSSIFQKIMFKMRFTEQTVALWRDPVFIVLFISDFMAWLVQFVPYVHLPERARLLGISSIHSAVIVSSMGFAGAVGKFCFGAICTFLKFEPLKTFIVAQILFGTSTILSPLCVTFSSLMVYAIVFGFLSGSYALMMVIPADLLGHEKFSAAYGFLLAGEGVGVYLGPPIVGWITDISESYETSFYCAGSMLLASALILLLQPFATRMRNRK